MMMMQRKPWLIALLSGLLAIGAALLIAKQF
jgi:hypothetical protein